MRRLLPAVLLLAAAAPAEAASLRERVERAAAPAGSRIGVAVADARTGRTLAAVRAAKVRPMGSTTKLATTAAALLGLPAHLETGVLLTAAVGPGGVLGGDVVLRGGGDPALGEPGMAALADAVVRAGVRDVQGSIVGDGTKFPPGTFDPELQGVVGSLTYDRGRQAPGGPIQPDPDRAAAFRLDDLLEARGVVVRGLPRGAAVPVPGPLLATARTPLRTVLALTNKPSDDLFAEILVRDLGGPAAARTLLRSRTRARLTLADGSGLSAGSRGAPRELVRLLRRMRTRSAFKSSLPVAGVDGTLRDRLRGTGCRAKTGTLPQGRVSALAGYCGSRVFAIQVDGLPVRRAERIVDRVVRVIRP